MNDTRDSYDLVAANYASATRHELAARPLDRALLAAFAELAIGPVVDFGCGPGHVTAHLHQLGLDVSGLDTSAGMIEVARAAYPEVRFEVGSAPPADARLGGLAAFYSIIHTPPGELQSLFSAFATALAPASPLLLAFQVGSDDRRHISSGFGHEVSLDAYRFDPENVVVALEAAGFEMLSRTIREPADPSEKGQRAYLLAVRNE
ncbi:class I SAM-dependent methyltransferase [soil metagenome]